jgi:hypothetical protein
MGMQEVRGEEKGGEQVGALQCLQLFPRATSGHIIFLLSLFSRACLAPALGIGLVYRAHYSRFAVAIATTRGQFIEGKEVHFQGVSFPAPVQSTAENKSPDTHGGNTLKSFL